MGKVKCLEKKTQRDRENLIEEEYQRRNKLMDKK